MERPTWTPDGIDVDTPSVARIYDHWLGGSHNFAADRAVGQKILSVVPHFQHAARTNRAFLNRAVRFMVDAGIRQFMDIGSGIPTVGNVHEVAQHAAPGARVMYVDIDPVAVTHSEQLLAGNDHAAVIRQDVRNPEAILEHPRTRELLDFDRPIGLLMVALLHYLPDADDPYTTVTRLRERLCAGSYVAIAHGTEDEQTPEAIAEAQRLTKGTSTPMRLRSRAEIEPFFTGLELVEPGLVWAPQWRPDDGAEADQPHRSVNYAAVGRVR